jgi:hypothetical protein
MSKDKPAARPAGARRGRGRAPAAVPTWLTSRGYTLDCRNSPTSFIFRLDVQGSDGNPYFLSVNQLNDRTGLLQKVLRVTADRSPAFDWEFQADASGSITDIR